MVKKYTYLISIYKLICIIQNDFKIINILTYKKLAFFSKQYAVWKKRDIQKIFLLNSESSEFIKVKISLLPKNDNEG